MKRTRGAVALLVAFFGLAWVVPPAAAGVSDLGQDSNESTPRGQQCPGGQVPLFAGGGTALTNGFFFPGTALYDGQGFVGVPYVVPQGCDLLFVNTDLSALTNGHQIISFKRRKGVPLFLSGFVAGPATAPVEISKLKPGVYPYFCAVHYSMFGLLEVTPTP